MQVNEKPVGMVLLGEKENSIMRGNSGVLVLFEFGYSSIKGT